MSQEFILPAGGDLDQGPILHLDIAASTFMIFLNTCKIDYMRVMNSHKHGRGQDVLIILDILGREYPFSVFHKEMGIAAPGLAARDHIKPDELYAIQVGQG